MPPSSGDGYSRVQREWPLQSDRSKLPIDELVGHADEHFDATRSRSAIIKENLERPGRDVKRKHDEVAGPKELLVPDLRPIATY
ncbi:hypothetical protein Q7P37_004384 [Cladosporium fusiforme]